MHNQPESKNVSPNQTSHPKPAENSSVSRSRLSPLRSFQRKRPLSFSLGKTFKSEQQQQKY